MPIRGSPNGARHPRPQAGRDCPEWVVAINRNGWSQSIGTAGRDHSVRALKLDQADRALVLGVSAATIDRLLVETKIAAAGGKRRRVGFYSAVRRGAG